MGGRARLLESTGAVGDLGYLGHKYRLNKDKMPLSPTHDEGCFLTVGGGGQLFGFFRQAA